MGSKGSQTTTTTQNQNQSYTANPAISGAANQAITGAEAAASSPFAMPVAPVAGFNPFQQQSFNQIQGAQGMTTPYFNTASNLMTNSAAPITASDVNQYYNPMADSVTAQLQNIFGQQNRQATGNAVQTAGGVGADRIGVAQGNLANQQTLAAGQTYAGLYQQALQQAQQQKQMEANAGYGEAALGQGAQSANLQATGALAGAGSQQQQLTQAQQNAQYQNALAQIAYQFQTPQYLAGIAGGLAPALGGTTVGSGTGSTTQPPPNILNSIIGGGLGGIGLLGASGLFGGGGGDAGANPGVAGYTGTVGGAGNQIVPTIKRGGRIGMEEGGDPGMPTVPEIPGVNPPNTGGLSPIPVAHLPMGGGQFHNNLSMNLTPQTRQDSGGGSNALGTIASLAKIGMMFANQGGAVMPEHALTGFDDGGDVALDDSPVDIPLPRPNPLGGLTPSMREKFPEIRSAAAERGVNFDIGEGYRPQQRQNMLYAQGRGAPGSIVTNTRNSNHTSGNAIDVLPTEGTTDKQVGDTLTDLTMHDPRFANMRSGATFSNLYDPRHIELLGNKEARTAGAPGVAKQDVADIPANATPTAQTGMGSIQYNQDMKPPNYGALPVPFPKAAEDSFGHRFANSPWLNLALAGAGMAASRSPFVGVALGEGMQAGLHGFETQRKQNLSEEEVNQKAMALAQQAQIHLDSYQRLTAAQQRDSYHPPIMSPYGDYAVALPKDPEHGKPMYYPLDQMGQPDTSKGTEHKPEAPPAQTSVAPAGGTVTNDDPTVMLNPGPVKGGAERDSSIATMYFDPKTRAAGRAAANTELKTVNKEADAANTLDLRAKSMRRNLDVIEGFVNDPRTGGKLAALLTPGATGDTRADLINKYQYARRLAPSLPPIPDEVVASVNALGKDSVLGGFSQIVSAGLSAREAQPIIRASMAAMPSFNLPGSSSRLLLASMEQAAQRQKDRQAFLADFRSKNGGYADGWETQFNKQHPPESYVARAAYSVLPEESKRTLPIAVKELRSARDELMKAEHSGDPAAADAARAKFLKGKAVFDRRYGSLGNYMAFGAM